METYQVSFHVDSGAHAQHWVIYTSLISVAVQKRSLGQLDM